MRIVFMGSPAFAVPSLKALVKSKEEVVGVVTQPDRPAHRGHRLTSPAVKVAAKELGIPIFQPESLKDKEGEKLLDYLTKLSPDLLVVVAYGLILPSSYLSLPSIAPLNVHASLLPKYRGAAPINWAIINGEHETGITIMQMVAKLDAGNILLQKKIPILNDETAGQLTERLSELGSHALLEAIALLKEGKAVFRPQDNSLATYAPMLKKEMGLIEWSKSALECHNHIRGLNPWPGAYTSFRNSKCKIHKTRIIKADSTDIPSSYIPGTIMVKEKIPLVVCGDGNVLEIIQIQLPGKKPTSGVDFVNGARLKNGEKFQ